MNDNVNQQLYIYILLPLLIAHFHKWRISFIMRLFNLILVKWEKLFNNSCAERVRHRTNYVTKCLILSGGLSGSHVGIFSLSEIIFPIACWREIFDDDDELMKRKINLKLFILKTYNYLFPSFSINIIVSNCWNVSSRNFIFHARNQISILRIVL